GTAAVAEPPQRQAEHRACVAAVERLERAVVAAADTLEQLLVGRVHRAHLGDRRGFPRYRQAKGRVQGILSGHHSSYDSGPRADFPLRVRDMLPPLSTPAGNGTPTTRPYRADEIAGRDRK